MLCHNDVVEGSSSYSICSCQCLLKWYCLDQAPLRCQLLFEIARGMFCGGSCMCRLQVIDRMEAEAGTEKEVLTELCAIAFPTCVKNKNVGSSRRRLHV